MDVIVTTPRSEMTNAAREAAECLAAGGGFYFRRFATLPQQCARGDRIFYVEDGFIRGFAVVDHWVVPGTHRAATRCDTTGKLWGPGYFAYMRADSWKWIIPIPMRGFQGWRYFHDAADVKIIGDWRAPKPRPIVMKGAPV